MTAPGIEPRSRGCKPRTLTSEIQPQSLGVGEVSGDRISKVGGVTVIAVGVCVLHCVVESVHVVEVVGVVGNRGLQGIGARLNLSKLTGVRHNFEYFNIVKAYT